MRWYIVWCDAQVKPNVRFFLNLYVSLCVSWVKLERLIFRSPDIHMSPKDLQVKYKKIRQVSRTYSGRYNMPQAFKHKNKIENFRLYWLRSNDFLYIA